MRRSFAGDQLRHQLGRDGRELEPPHPVSRRRGDVRDRGGTADDRQPIGGAGPKPAPDVHRRARRELGEMARDRCADGVDTPLAHILVET